MNKTIAHQCIQYQIEALQALPQVLETAEYAELVKLVSAVAVSNYDARVFITGVGKNSNIATKISETMASLGIPSFYLNVSHAGHGDAGFVGPRDVVLHISRSGGTREMLVAIEHLRLIRPLAKQALIHCKPGREKNQFVDVELCIGAVTEGDEHGLAPTTSTTALLCILDCISVQASQNANFRRLDFLKFHPDGALGELLAAEVLQSELQSSIKQN